jgi:hypothetical protein
MARVFELIFSFFIINRNGKIVDRIISRDSKNLMEGCGWELYIYMISVRYAVLIASLIKYRIV